MTTTEVAVQEQATKALAQISPESAPTEEIIGADIIIPKLLLMQGQSEFVSERKAISGDFVRSTNGEKLGDDKTPVDFIPLTFNQTWRIEEKVGKKWEYRSTEPLVAANKDLPWNFQKDGTEWKRVKCLNLYALLPRDVQMEMDEIKKCKEQGEMPDPDKALMPVLISFRSTSYKAGQTVVTHFAKARKFGLHGYVSILRLKCYQDTNDSGTFYVLEVDKAGKTPKEFFEVCEYWRNLSASNKVKVDESTEARESSEGSVGESDQY